MNSLLYFSLFSCSQSIVEPNQKLESFKESFPSKAQNAILIQINDEDKVNADFLDSVCPKEDLNVAVEFSEISDQEYDMEILQDYNLDNYNNVQTDDNNLQNSIILDQSETLQKIYDTNQSSEILFKFQLENPMIDHSSVNNFLDSQSELLPIIDNTNYNFDDFIELQIMNAIADCDDKNLSSTDICNRLMQIPKVFNCINNVVNDAI